MTNSKKEICAICGLTKRVQKRVSSAPVCHQCYNKHFRPKTKCSVCGEEKITEKWIDNNSICPSCYKKKFRIERICSICNQIKKTDKFIGNISICPTCYNKLYRIKHMGICSFCGRNMELHILSPKAICYTCYYIHHRPRRLCSICGKTSVVRKQFEYANYCKVCYNKYFKKQCAICSKLSRTEKLIDGKSICPSCYGKNYQPKRSCFICQKQTVSIRLLQGKRVCINCYYNADGYHFDKVQDFINTYSESINNNDILILLKKYSVTLLRYLNPFYVFSKLINEFDIFVLLDTQNIALSNLSYDYFDKLSENSNINLSLTLENFLLKEHILKPYDEIDIIRKDQFKMSEKIPDKFKSIYIYIILII